VGQDARELAGDGFVEWLIQDGEVASVEPTDARRAVGEGKEAGEGWAPRIEFDCVPDLDDGREEFKEIIGNLGSGGRVDDEMAPGDAGGDGITAQTFWTRVQEE
jgi:hypothetical protein